VLRREIVMGFGTEDVQSRISYSPPVIFFTSFERGVPSKAEQMKNTYREELIRKN
jgi:hypothetical protein